MLYKADLKKIKQELNFSLLEKEKKLEAFNVIIKCLDQYKRKQINKYFFDLVKNIAPKYQVKYDSGKKDIPKFSVSHHAAYSLYTFNVHFSDRVLHFDGIDAYMREYQEIIYFKKDENGNVKNTPEDLRALINARIEGVKGDQEKMKNELKNIDAIYQEYNDLNVALDRLTDKLTYQTLDALKNKDGYSIIQKYN